MPLKLVRRKGSAHHYLRGTVRGQRIFETTGTDDRKAADAIRVQREAQLLKRSVFGPGATVTFAEAAVSYLAAGGEATYLGTQDEKTDKWSLLLGRFYDDNVGAIGQDEADRAAQEIYPGTKASTRIRCCYAPLKSVLNHAAQRKWCPPPAIENPAVEAVVTRYSSPERLAKLLPECAPKLRLFVMVSAYTGGRLSEILRIDWDRDVFLARRTIMLWKTKEQQRAVYIPDPLIEDLAAVPEAARRGPMFHWSDKTHVHKPLKAACKRAGVEYLPPHQQGRHTYATWLMDYGEVGLKGLMDAGGWTSVQSVMRYLHVTPGKAARQADKFPGAKVVQNASSVPAESIKQPRKLRRKSA